MPTNLETDSSIPQELYEQCFKDRQGKEPSKAKFRKMEDLSDPMPLYRCHKEVQALKIKSILSSENGATITPTDESYNPFYVSAEYVKRNNTMIPGGYYVRYEDGYESYSPAEPFEAGYTLIAR